MSTMTVRLRNVRQEDLVVLFEHQADPVAAEMAAFESRDRAAFMEHWHRILSDAGVRAQAITADNRVVGNIVAFWSQERRLLGYWIARDVWGQGVASAAVAQFVRQVETTRPLHALVTATNVGSRRVLEKCDFSLVEELFHGKVAECLYCLQDAAPSGRDHCR